MKPRLLDLFCGAGGCSVGYARAGFDVVGVDIEPHDDYPFELIVGDAIEYIRGGSRGFDVIHGSPPCPRYSSMTRVTGSPDSHPDLVAPVRDLLQVIGVPYVIENVLGAPLIDPVTICGPAMGLPGIRRHRIFESNVLLLSPGCACTSDSPFGIYGDHGDKTYRPHADGHHRAGKARDVAHAQELMGINWMTRWDDLADAIPPAYTEHIGAQLIEHLAVAA